MRKLAGAAAFAASILTAVSGFAQAPVELRYMCYADANECEVSRELLDKFERANPGIKVVVDKKA